MLDKNGTVYGGMTEKLGIIAAGGEIPQMVIDAAKKQGREIAVVVLQGITDVGLDFRGVPFISVKVAQGGKIIRFFKSEKVKEVVFIGSIRRPSLTELALDWWTAKILAKRGFSVFGDDSLLSLVIKITEDEGFKVIGAHTILPELLAVKGAYGKYSPDKTAGIDIKRGFEVAKGLGKFDVGQSVAVQQGMVIGVEAIEGTDALIARCGGLQRKGLGGVLVKVKKPEQEERIDLPTIGVKTVENVAAAGLRGIAVESGSTLVVNPVAVVAAADRLGIFVVGI